MVNEVTWISKFNIMWKRLPVVLATAFLVGFAPLPLRATTPAERHFRIEAGRYEFSPAVIKVNPGDRVTIELVALDVVHGIYIDGYDIEVSGDPGQTTTLSFVAEKEGKYRFRCSIACGAMHPFMTGKLQVGPDEMFIRAAGLSIVVVFSVLWMVRRKID